MPPRWTLHWDWHWVRLRPCKNIRIQEIDRCGSVVELSYLSPDYSVNHITLVGHLWSNIWLVLTENNRMTNLVSYKLNLVCYKLNLVLLVWHWHPLNRCHWMEYGDITVTLATINNQFNKWQVWIEIFCLSDHISYPGANTSSDMAHSLSIRLSTVWVIDR